MRGSWSWRRKICDALTVHTQIEEEIFYPAFWQATQDKDMHHEAEVEHAGAKNLIAEIKGSGPDDDYYDAKVHVLSEMIKHHVKEEEQRGGMFAEAKQSDMDLLALGAQLRARKEGTHGRIGRWEVGRLCRSDLTVVNVTRTLVLIHRVGAGTAKQ